MSAEDLKRAAESWIDIEEADFVVDEIVAYEMDQLNVPTAEATREPDEDEEPINALTHMHRNLWFRRFASYL
jgi:hypothetical protein